jgi:uncharacterized membrane protein YphA (DoxX/SURF4 family)
MRHRDRIGLNLPPLLLRIMLGVIFVHAGLGKLLGELEAPPADAAVLANLRLVRAPVKVASPPAAPASPATPSTPAEGEQPQPEAPAVGPEASAPAAPQSSTAPATTPQQTAGAGSGMYTAADFPGPVKVRMVNMLALGIYKAGNPEPLEGGAKVRPIWPPDLAKGTWPRNLAWAVTLTELVGGALVLLGALTRLWSLSLVVVMAGAMWLTQFGPAQQTGQTRLGFLPDYPLWGMEWSSLMIQFALFMAALALALLGPGRVSLDYVVLGGRGDADDDE